MLQLFTAVISRVLLELLELQEKMVRQESVDPRAPQDQLEQPDQGYCIRFSVQVYYLPSIMTDLY